MTWFKMAGLAASLAVGAYTVDQVVEHLGPQASVMGATQSITNVAGAAYYEHTLTGGDWEEILERTVSEARNAEALTVDGTSVYWRHEESCFVAHIPSPDVEPTVEECSDGQ